MYFEDQVEFKRHYKVLCYFAWEMVKDTEVAEDLVQDAFMAYLNNKHRVSSEPLAIRSFLYSTYVMRYIIKVVRAEQCKNT